jgi:hypothetical protein
MSRHELKSVLLNHRGLRSCSIFGTVVIVALFIASTAFTVRVLQQGQKGRIAAIIDNWQDYGRLGIESKISEISLSYNDGNFTLSSKDSMVQTSRYLTQLNIICFHTDLERFFNGSNFKYTPFRFAAKLPQISLTNLTLLIQDIDGELSALPISIVPKVEKQYANCVTNKCQMECKSMGGLLKSRVCSVDWFLTTFCLRIQRYFDPISSSYKWIFGNAIMSPDIV